eukprot:9569975-Alexandrium_andersonii.AAC.1
MSASLVGSEMCIRDSSKAAPESGLEAPDNAKHRLDLQHAVQSRIHLHTAVWGVRPWVFSDIRASATRPDS